MFLCWEDTQPRGTAVTGEGLAPAHTAASRARHLQCKVMQMKSLAHSEFNTMKLQ